MANEPIDNTDIDSDDGDESTTSADIERLKKALDAERKVSKEQKRNAAEQSRRAAELSKTIDGLGGEDALKELLELKQRLEADEELKLFGVDREKYNERITGRMKADYEKRLAGAEETLTARDRKIQELSDSLARAMIHGAIRERAAKQPEFVAEATDVLVRLAGDVFRLGDNHQPEARDADGELIMGKDGKALTIDEWIESTRDSHPYFWRPRSGTGARAGDGSIARGGMSPEAIGKMSLADYRKARQEGRIK